MLAIGDAGMAGIWIVLYAGWYMVCPIMKFTTIVDFHTYKIARTPYLTDPREFGTELG